MTPAADSMLFGEYLVLPDGAYETVLGAAAALLARSDARRRFEERAIGATLIVTHRLVFNREAGELHLNSEMVRGD